MGALIVIVFPAIEIILTIVPFMDMYCPSLNWVELLTKSETLVIYISRECCCRICCSCAFPILFNVRVGLALAVELALAVRDDAFEAVTIAVLGLLLTPTEGH